MKRQYFFVAAMATAVAMGAALAAQTQPPQSKPTQAQPAPAKPAQVQPAGQKPAQAQTTPAKPADTQPAQAKTPKAPAPQGKTAPAPCPKPLALTDVVQLLTQHTSPRRIIAKIESCGVDFGLTSEREAVLRAASGTDPVIAAVQKASDKFVAERDAESQRQQEAEDVRLKVAEEADWQTAKVSLDPADVESFLKQYPDTAHAVDARIRLADLRPASRPSVKDARGIAWVQIPAGSYDMGCTAGDAECYSDEKPAHRVVLTKPFWLMTTEVSVGQYRATGFVVPEQPAWSTSDRDPIVNVGWDQAARTCRAVGGRLPTEAEWEYSARGGAAGSPYVWGPNRTPLVDGRPAANVADAAAALKTHEAALFEGYDDGFAEAAPVGLFAANGYGLFDMAGNVWEWVADWYDAAIYKKAAKPNPTGPTSGRDHVVRGGSWGNAPKSLRVSVRAFGTPSILQSIGIRCARDNAP